MTSAKKNSSTTSTPPTRCEPADADRARTLTRARQLAIIALLALALAAALLVRHWQRVEADRRAGVSGATIGYRVDVNTADVAELQLLPGVGPTIAEAIIEHRRTRGQFRSSDDLMRVKGIGATIAHGVEPYVKFGEAAPVGAQ